MKLSARHFGLAGVLAALVSLAPVAAVGADAILILDASGSMWGQVDGQTKISAARRAVDTILAKWKPDDRLGLMAYGHRAKGDCKDIELMVPVSRFDPARIKAAVAGLNPKGKTPIADSLRAAAEALKTTETRATVVLVSDGIETCAPDPCAVATELKKAGVGFTAHVVGFDVTDPAAKTQLQCIARATGGVYLDARNAATLETALGRAVEATQGGKVASEAPAKPARDAFAGKNLRGTVRLAEGLDPISDDSVSWSFHADDNGEKGDTIKEFYGAPIAETMAPGSYLVEVQYGEVRRTFPAKIEKDKRTTLDLVLDAGFVTSEASRIGRDGKLDDVAWEVRDSQGEAVATAYDPVPRFILPAGAYVLALSKEQAKAEKPFTLTAGDQINVELALDAGRLFVSGLYAAGGPKVTDGLSVEVRQPKTAAGEDGESVTTTYEALAKFELPSGSYEVLVSVGQAMRSFAVKVVSGETTRLEAVLDAGVAAIKAPKAETLEIVRAERDINGAREIVATSHDEQFSAALNAGSYVAVSHLGNDRTVEKAFEIAPGKRIEIEVK
ncbi:MAG: VWA domain-containing protein [Xanthobacteraceae bacterium]